MSTATISSRGQLVIPVEVRRAVGWEPGDQVTFSVVKGASTVSIKRKETPAEISRRLARLPRANVPPLVDAHEFYDTREPRL